MKVVVSGSREWDDIETVRIAFNKYISGLPENVVLIEGGCRGLDIIARRVGKENGYQIRDLVKNEVFIK